MKSPEFKLRSRPKNNNRIWVIVGVSIAVAILLILSFILITQRHKRDGRDDTVQTESAKDKVANLKNNTEGNNLGLPSNSETTTSDQVPISENITVSITEINQTSGTVSTSASIQGIQSDGTCVFTYTSDDKPVVRQVTSSNQRCSTSIPEVEFTKIGNWNLNVTFYNDSQKAETDQSVTIQ